MTEHELTNETHRAECAQCTAEWAELEEISAEARALPTLTPSRDLWAGIEARISGGATAGGATATPSASEQKAQRRWFASPLLRQAAAAVVLVAGTATITWKLAGRGGDEQAQVAQGTNGIGTVPVESLGVSDANDDRIARIREVTYEDDFDAMDLEVIALQELVTKRRAQLDSTTLAVLDKNLAVIDTALKECRDAFRRDPSSQFLAAQLARSYQTKLTLLRSTATMPVGL